MKKTIFLALPLLLLACGREPVAPHASSLNANFMNNPDNGNPRIWRGVADLAISWTDPGNGLRALHRTTPVAGSGCAEFEPAGGIDWQELWWEDANDIFASRLIENNIGNVFIVIRDLNVPGTCFGGTLVASGWGTIHRNDNDILSGNPNYRNNKNAFSFRAHGALTTPTGETVQYNGHAHITWDPDQDVVTGVTYQVVVR